jgi:hypothetical protein
MSKEAMKLARSSLKELVAQVEGRLFSIKHDHFSMQDARSSIRRLEEALAKQEQGEPVANAWAEGYRMGIVDERISEANIGIAGFNAKVEPARQNPYGTPQPKQKQEVDWKDMYEKEKRRSAMWIAKYEKDIGPLERAVPAKQEQGEPVAWTIDSLEQEIYENTREFVSLNVMEWLLTRFNTTPQQRTWVGLMRGVRVEGDTVVISVKGGNDAARELCGELINEMNT